MGNHLLQSPSSPEPQDIGLRLPQRQSQTKLMRHGAMLGAMAMPGAIFTKQAYSHIQTQTQAGTHSYTHGKLR